MYCGVDAVLAEAALAPAPIERSCGRSVGVVAQRDEFEVPTSFYYKFKYPPTT